MRDSYCPEQPKVAVLAGCLMAPLHSKCIYTMTDPNQLVKIMREKMEIGEYPLSEVLGLLADGTLRSTDYYWFKSLPHWVKLSELELQERVRAKAEVDRLVSEAKAEEERLFAEEVRFRVEKELFDRKVAEAIRLKLGKEDPNLFRCHCCRVVFRNPSSISRGAGVALMVCALIGLLISSVFVGVLAKIVVAGFSVSLLLMGVGLCIFLASLLRSPYCPSCESTNFSKPEKSDAEN